MSNVLFLSSERVGRDILEGQGGTQRCPGPKVSIQTLGGEERGEGPWRAERARASWRRLHNDEILFFMFPAFKEKSQRFHVDFGS